MSAGEILIDNARICPEDYKKPPKNKFAFRIRGNDLHFPIKKLCNWWWGYFCIRKKAQKH